MLQGLRLRSIRKSQIANLQVYIDGVYDSELSKAKTPGERIEAALRAQSICEVERNELALLRENELQRRKFSKSRRFIA
jgi:hypothetical protein